MINVNGKIRSMTITRLWSLYCGSVQTHWEYHGRLSNTQRSAAEERKGLCRRTAYYPASRWANGCGGYHDSRPDVLLDEVSRVSLASWVTCRC